jgi:hypothetical protein
MTRSGPFVGGALLPVSPVGPRVTVSVGGKAISKESAAGGVDAGWSGGGEGLWGAGASGGVDSGPAWVDLGETGMVGGGGTSGAALAVPGGVTPGATGATTGVSGGGAASDGARATGPTEVPGRPIRGRSAEAAASCRSLVATTGWTRST